MTNVRDWLGMPIPQRPSEHLILQRILMHTQNLMNRLSNTGKPWTTKEVFLTVQAGRDDHPLPVSNDFGKVLSVTTYDPGNPAHVERQIPVYEPQNLSLEWTHPQDAGYFFRPADGSPHTALRIAFMRLTGGEQSGFVARLRPIPQEPATYRILYSIGNWYDEAGLGSSPVLSEHHHLIEIMAAQSLLPMTSWHAEEERDAPARKEFAATFERDEARLMPVFEDYVRSITKGRIVFRRNARY